MNNKQIKKILRSENIPQWKLAKTMGVCEATIQRLLRNDEDVISDSKQKDILKCIELLKE